MVEAPAAAVSSSHGPCSSDATASKQGRSRPRTLLKPPQGVPYGSAVSALQVRSAVSYPLRPAKAIRQPSRRSLVPKGSAPSTDRRRAGASPADPSMPPASGRDGGSGERHGPGGILARCPGPVQGPLPSAGTPCPRHAGEPEAAARRGFSTADSYCQRGCAHGMTLAGRTRPRPPRVRASPAAGRGEAIPLVLGSRPRGAGPQGLAETPNGSWLRWGAAVHRF